MGERFCAFLLTLSLQARRQLEMLPRSCEEDRDDKELALTWHSWGARHLCRPLHPCSYPCKVGTAPFVEREGPSGQEGQGTGHCS